MTPDPVYVRTSTAPLGTSIHIVTGALDELNCEPGWPTSPPEVAMLMAGCSGASNGQCSWLEALAAAQGNRAVDVCPAGVADVTGADALYIDPSAVPINLGRQFNMSSSFGIFGDINAPAMIALGGRTRAFFGSGGMQDLELSGVQCDGGCPHGGNCLADATGDVPQGGCVYKLSSGALNFHDSIFSNNTARGGGAIDACTAGTNSIAMTLDNVRIEDNTAYSVGGGGLEMHGANTLVANDSFFRRNRVLGSDTTSGGNLKVNGGTATLANVVFEDGVSALGLGGNISVGGPGSSAVSTAPIVVTMIGGALRRGIANGNGGDVWVQAGSDGTGVGNNYCPSGGCSLILRDVEVTDGTADSPTSWPAGNGGLLATNNTGTHPGTIRLEGSTTLSGGVDLTAPSFPQIFGLVIDARPVCGNGVLESPEECDDHNTMSGDGCSSACEIEGPPPTVCGNGIVEPGEQCDGGACCAATCQFAVDGFSCSDGNVCNGAESCSTGSCSIVAPACGNGVLEPACGEACDDGNAVSHDGCSSACAIEICTCE